MKKRLEILTWKYLLNIILVSLVTSSCDLLRVAPFEIVSWNPGPGRHLVTDDIPLTVEFSEEPDRASAESSFSLTEDGAVLSGGFSWLGSTLAFLPCGGLRANAEYRLTVSADAKNACGVSLEQPFEVTFSSKPDDVRPVIVSTFPAQDGILETGTDAVCITCSEAVAAVSFRDCISFSPLIKGIWNLKPGDRTTFFTPLEPWICGTEYTVTISDDLLDTSGNRLAEPFSFCFSVGSDQSPPRMLRAEAIDEGGLPVAEANADVPQDGLLLENPGWEASWKLRLHYSEPVACRTLASSIEGYGGIALELIWVSDVARSIDLRITGYPAWGNGFSILVPSGVEDAAGNASQVESMFRFVFDGPQSRPPRFVGIRLPLSPGEALPESRNLAVFSVDQPYATIAITGDAAGYPVGIPVATSIEIYVELASCSSMNILSLMKSFRFSSTNGALDFSANRMLAEGLEYVDPYGPWAGFALARIDGSLTNRVDSGLLTVQLAAGFSDSSGNASGAAQRLTLQK